MHPKFWPDPARHERFSRWLQPLVEAHGLLPDTLAEAGSDASTRRYFRIRRAAGGELLVMDAPPPGNDLRPYLALATHMAECGLRVPEVLAADAAEGFALITDLGPQTYLQALQGAGPAEADRLMRAAIGSLVQWQQRGDAGRLPVYDEAFVRRELQIFVDWCVQAEFGKQWSATQLKWWDHVCQQLVKNALAQPQVAMHRDYMVRNLMVNSIDAQGAPGILDFQDAVRGPIAYDMASLLRDAFISWDEERELDWAIRYWEQARQAGLPIDADFGEFWKALEWSGLQRHLKMMGIFCRLKHRDGKPAYAEDLPRLFAYATKVSTRYIEFSPLTHLLEDLRGGLTQTGFSLR